MVLAAMSILVYGLGCTPARTVAGRATSDVIHRERIPLAFRGKTRALIPKELISTVAVHYSFHPEMFEKRYALSLWTVNTISPERLDLDRENKAKYQVLKGPFYLQWVKSGAGLAIMVGKEKCGTIPVVRSTFRELPKYPARLSLFINAGDPLGLGSVSDWTFLQFSSVQSGDIFLFPKRHRESDSIWDKVIRENGRSLFVADDDFDFLAALLMKDHAFISVSK
jgi:hypothetical protein